MFLLTEAAAWLTDENHFDFVILGYRHSRFNPRVGWFRKKHNRSSSAELVQHYDSRRPFQKVMQLTERVMFLEYPEQLTEVGVDC